jgi:hypothetical protein
MNGLLARRKKMPSSVVGKSLGKTGFDSGAEKNILETTTIYLTVRSSEINIGN